MASSNWEVRAPAVWHSHNLLEKKPVGLILGNGGYWKEGRKVTLRLLHRFGFFQVENAEKIVQREFRELLEKGILSKINSEAPAVVRVQYTFQIHMLNIVYQAVLGKRFEPDNSTALQLCSFLNDFNAENNASIFPLTVLPWLKHLPFFTFHQSFVKLNRFFKDWFHVNPEK